MPNTLWIDTVLLNDIAAAGQDVRSLMTGVSSGETRLAGMTLLRTIIRVDIGAVVHDQGEGDCIVHLGIGVTDQEAIAASVVPDPETASDFPVRGWVWRANYRVQSFAADQPVVHIREIDKDIRARRKLDNGESFMVTTNVAGSGTPSMRVSGLIRQLYLLT